MAEIKQLKEKKTDEIFYPVTVGEAVIFEDGRSAKDKIEKLSTYIETTYSNLKSLRDNNQLIPGALYRITDYVTTTAQENTRSAGHQFDIIVQAISESVLSEDARAINHKYENKFTSVIYAGVTYPYVDSKYITFSDNVRLLVHRFFEGVSDQYWVNDKHLENCLVGVTDSEYEEVGDELVTTIYDSDDIDDNTCTIEYSDYFSSCNLAAWKLKYCLDNDENRFAWAKNLYLSPISHNKCISLKDDYDGTSLYVRQSQLDNENGCAWCLDDQGVDLTIKEYNEQGIEIIEQNIVIYTPSEDVYIGQSFTINGDHRIVIDFSEQGKGVIYQMIDEYNNNCPYDFKNVQTNVKNLCVNSKYVSWCEEVGTTSNTNSDFYYTFSDKNGDDASLFSNKVYSNIIEKRNLTNKLHINKIVIVGTTVYGNKFFYGCHEIFLGDDCIENVFMNTCYSLIIGNHFKWNVCKNFTNSSVKCIGIYRCEIKSLDAITISTADYPDYYYLGDSLIYFGASSELSFEIDENYQSKIVCLDNSDSILIEDFHKIFSDS